ncbi:NAD-dependent epimerase/dehydratase family protein [Streptomyces sp. AF1A]|uniref:NAD-dependent epimerase/dehydratase family protein n=1 Tax=Streptomyces sp. AF1A TaxID=3394350 RepID=UPI0039BCC1F6
MTGDTPFPWRRALVTGGAGFLGSHLCERLLDSGVQVDCADNLVCGRRRNVCHLEDRPGFRFVECDVCAADCAAQLPGPYDLVLHFAGPASPADCLRMPLESLDAGSLGTRNALGIAERDGARFLLASACAAYGGPQAHPRHEGSRGHVNPVRPRSVYDESKRFGEALVTAHAGTRGTDAGIVRPSHTYGPRMRAHDGSAVPTFIAQALAGEPVTVTGDGSRTRSLCYVDDTVDGILRVAASRSARLVTIGGSAEITVADLARLVVALTGSRSPIAFVDRPVDDPGRRRPHATLARELLGWSPQIPWEEGLKQTIAYFSARPWAPVPTEEDPAPQS